jgi:proline iminopeptidase
MDPASASAPAGTASTPEILGGVKIQLHYLASEFFLRPHELLDNLWRIKSLPVIIVQGRMDMVCPPLAAFAVARGIGSSELCMVSNGGHSALQPQIAAELCAATRRIQARIER